MITCKINRIFEPYWIRGTWLNFTRAFPGGSAGEESIKKQADVQICCGCLVTKSILWCSAFFIIQLSHPDMTTGETIALNRRTFVGKVMSLLFNMLYRLVIALLSRSSSVQFSHSVVSDSLRSHESQHARLPCPSPTPTVYSNSYPSNRWYHPTISSSVIPFSSCPQFVLASGTFQMSRLFTSGGHSTGVSASASVLPMNTQDWSL